MSSIDDILWYEVKKDCERLGIPPESLFDSLCNNKWWDNDNREKERDIQTARSGLQRNTNDKGTGLRK